MPHKKHLFRIAQVLGFVLVIMYSSGFASFLRTGGWKQFIPVSDPATIKYGYGYGDQGRGYGTGAGYSGTGNTKEDLINQNNYGSGNLDGDTDEINTISSGSVNITINTGTMIIVNGVVQTGLATFPSPIYSTTIPARFSESSSTIKGVVDLTFVGNAQFTKPIKIEIPVVGVSSVYIKANHGGGFMYLGLTTNPNGTCSGGEASPAYLGEAINVSGGKATIYTCAASTFAAYTIQSSPPPSGGGGGGGSPAAKDSCPNGDKSGDSYDGKCNDNNKDGLKVKTITSSGEVENNLLTDSIPDDYTYGIEFNDAYKFALTNSITTAKTIKQANMTGKIQRSHLAKMMVNYAINVLGKTPDTSKSCSFDDVSSQNAELRGYIKQACQLGLMGVNIKAFNPKEKVTRAEFATILSRSLRGTTYNKTGGDYYSKHIKALKSKNIIKDGTPTLIEVRGYIMTMLMRASP